MRVMPSNNGGWFFQCLARETGKLGHLYSPGDQRGPWPWFPYSLDNGCFGLWNPKDNTFNEGKWLDSGCGAWLRLLFWANANHQKPLWAIVPDRPGDWDATVDKWGRYTDAVSFGSIPLAIAVQDGATVNAVANLKPTPQVICVGGSTEWKWGTAQEWIECFPRVHVLRCNSPDKLHWLEKLGCESTDGTGWNRGDRVQTKGLEDWARGLMHQHEFPLWPHASRKRDSKQLSFA